MEAIKSLRTEINGVNNEIIRLLIKRNNISKQIGNEKRALGLPVYDPTRETSIYESIKKNHPENYKYISSVFEEIIKQSRIIQN